MTRAFWADIWVGSSVHAVMGTKTLSIGFCDLKGLTAGYGLKCQSSSLILAAAPEREIARETIAAQLLLIPHFRSGLGTKMPLP